MATRTSLDDFLRPLSVDVDKVYALARTLRDTYLKLALESQDQFLATPISESILRPEGEQSGRYLAIDIGGTNLRVGFIELCSCPGGKHDEETSLKDGQLASEHLKWSRVKRELEKSWPIGEQLKSNKAENLFAWIGNCIAEVVQDACTAWPGQLPATLSLGVTFSFPMEQHTLSHATLMSMGKGFALESRLDLGKQLLHGYDLARDSSLPKITIAAIANDAVATLVGFAYQFRKNPRRKAAMGLIVGTGCNATIPLALSKLHPTKRPATVEVLNNSEAERDPKIAVNTEWTIKGAAGPLRELGFVTGWDTKLDQEGEAPGFQPFEYMTAGRYLGELGRIIIVDYFTNYLGIPVYDLPLRLRERHRLTTTFLGNLGSHLAVKEPSMLKQLEAELPPTESAIAFRWTEESAAIVFKIAKAIELRAAAMVAAAIVALLACADEIDLTASSSVLTSLTNGIVKATSKESVAELMVGYTGGCIVHFQDYLEDCQVFLDELMHLSRNKQRVVLKPCHDGGIIGAGILAGTVQNISHVT